MHFCLISRMEPQVFYHVLVLPASAYRQGRREAKLWRLGQHAWRGLFRPLILIGLTSCSDMCTAHDVQPRHTT